MGRCNVRRGIKGGMVRHTCKGCDFHVCDTCFAARMASGVGFGMKSASLPTTGMTPTSMMGYPVGPRSSLPSTFVLASTPEVPAGGPAVGHVESTATLKRRPTADLSGKECLPACQFGTKCYRRNLQHLQQYVHPGDRNYRLGMVSFPIRGGVRVKPEFNSLRDLFNYCDPDESGNISQDEFQAAWDLLSNLPAEMFGDEASNLRELTGGEASEAWEAAAGENSHLTFAMFARWASDVKLKLPVGIDVSAGAERSCRFQYAGGKRCPCTCFKASETHANMCECGHKSSVHCSDFALMTFEEQEVLNKLKFRALGRKGTGVAGMGDIGRKPGFDMVTNKEVLADLQRLLTETHKDHDNWTRDRGCALHGRNACGTDCIMRNKAPVPTGYELVRAERNRNMPLWQTFAMSRAAIAEECRSGSVEFERFEPRSALDVAGEQPLDPSINEWRLLHGTSLAAIKSICASNFRMKLAGTGATWKDGGKAAGTPLYGFGVYNAECITKADEYSDIITRGLPMDEGCCAVLVCRVVGGLCRLVDTNEFDTDEIRSDVLDGPYHSVFGDRVVKLGKPFREIVVYDSAQVFPEFILYYRRLGLPG
eukprot:TRINITY_DN28687_c0_g1_i1.p1 TRINITY_DN28687_c0_g1~~TRINITY_DN28687_c0_g1_i1.p1  ORF type:complete len:595 (+),score=116.98 TRINITY_DN28687_c0_g1_i1:176-1960(+)